MDGEISPDELAELLAGDDDVRVIDIRDGRGFERARVPGSENVPFRELPDRIEAFAGADRVVTVCPHGKASVQAARLVGSYEGCADARVESLAGGLEAWSERYDLVGTDDAEAGTDRDRTDDRPSRDRTEAGVERDRTAHGSSRDRTDDGASGAPF